MTTSVGISLYPDDGADADALLRNADIALYRAKERGRNNFQLCTPALNAAIRERLALESGLRRAVDNGEFVLYFQPEVLIPSRTIVGAEALVRWQHPERGLLAPDSFIPLAEDTRLIVPMGEWILHEACAQAAKFPSSGGRPWFVAVNLSARQFHRGGLVKTVEDALRASGLPPDRLELEITESVAMGDIQEAISTLRRLREMGVRVVLDDFGTGHSSLAYLKSLPLDAIKIDRTFVAAVPGTGSGRLAREGDSRDGARPRPARHRRGRRDRGPARVPPGARMPAGAGIPLRRARARRALRPLIRRVRVQSSSVGSACSTSRARGGSGTGSSFRIFPSRTSARAWRTAQCRARG